MKMDEFLESCVKSEEMKFILLKIYEISLKEFKKQMERIQLHRRSEYTCFESAESQIDIKNFPNVKKDFDLWMLYFIIYFSELCDVENKLKVCMIEVSSIPTHTINESRLEEIFIIEMQHYLTYSLKRPLRYYNADYLFTSFIKRLIKDFTPQIIENIKANI